MNFQHQLGGWQTVSFLLMLWCASNTAFRKKEQMRDLIIVALLVVSFLMFRFYRTWAKETRKKREQQGLPFDFWVKIGGLIPALVLLVAAVYLFVT